MPHRFPPLTPQDPMPKTVARRPLRIDTPLPLVEMLIIAALLVHPLLWGL